MKNPVLRWGLILLGGLVALTLAGAGLIFFLLSRLDIRHEIERAVAHATGRQLVIAGDVGVSFYPVLGLRAEEASLANAPGGRAPALASIGAFKIGVRIAPLFRREVVVSRLVLDHPRIALEVDAQGRPNWVRSPALEALTGPAHEAAASAQPLQSEAFTLERVEIRHGEVSYLDARRNTAWIVSDVNLNTALTSLEAPMNVRGDLVYAGQKVSIEAAANTPGAIIAGRPMALTAHIDAPLVKGAFQGEVAAPTGVFEGTVALDGPSFRRLVAWLVAPIQAGYGLEAFTVCGRLETAPRQVSFSNASLTLDALRGRGDFVLQQEAGRPYVSGRLEVFDLDINPYLAAAAAAPGASDAAIAEAGAAPRRSIDVREAPTEAPLDFSGLKAINADLELTAGSLKMQRMHFDRTQLSLVVHDGYLAATLHQIGLYGGTGAGRVEIDARTPDTHFRQELRADGVDARAMLGDAVGFSNLEGRTEINYALETHGRTQADLIRALDGRISFEVVGGTLHGVDLGGVATTIRRALNNELIAPEARTRLNGMSATFRIADGVMASDSLSFNTPELRLRGMGLIDLPARTLDMRVAAVGALLAIPFRVRGPWTGLLYASDLSGRGRDELAPRIRAVQQAR
ncbi:MAG: AsmA family protein [Hyphomonadaceae bacterium]